MRKIKSDEVSLLQPPTLSKEEVEKIRNSIINSMNQMTSIVSNTAYYSRYKEYQEPERDEQGVFYGYKMLKLHKGRFFSPMRPAQWSLEGFLEADRVPTEENSNGVYFCKTENDKEFEWIVMYHSTWGSRFLLVKCAVSGDVIEGETGFRSQYAQIIAVKVDREWINYEHWKDYQDTQEHSQNHSRDYAEEEEWKYDKLAWKAY